MACSAGSGWLNRKAMNRAAEAELSKLRIRVNSVRAPCESLSGGQRQAVAVARATAWDPAPSNGRADRCAGRGAATPSGGVDQ